VFEVDPLRCACGAAMRVVGFMTGPDLRRQTDRTQALAGRRVSGSGRARCPGRDGLPLLAGGYSLGAEVRPVVHDRPDLKGVFAGLVRRSETLTQSFTCIEA